jgi:hypothetical protein
MHPRNPSFFSDCFVNDGQCSFSLEKKFTPSKINLIFQPLSGKFILDQHSTDFMKKVFVFLSKKIFFLWQAANFFEPSSSVELSFPVPTSPYSSVVLASEVFSGAYLPPSPSLLPRSSSVVVPSVSRSQVLLSGSSYALALLQDRFRPIPP